MAELSRGLRRTLETCESHESKVLEYNMESDISGLEAPTFTTIDRVPSVSVTQLRWDHRVNLIGKKVANPMIHICDVCSKPILIYGRLIPCKHVFCLLCARSEKSSCSRCGEKFSRVETAGLGSIYMCSHGGSRYGNTGCQRTYLSQRDLEAHITHRHVKSSTLVALAPPPLPNLVADRITPSLDDRKASASNIAYSSPISVISTNRVSSSSSSSSNLITVPLEGQQPLEHYYHSAPSYGPPPYGPPPPNYSNPPPNYTTPICVGGNPESGFYNYEHYSTGNWTIRNTLPGNNSSNVPATSSSSNNSNNGNNNPYYRR